MTSTPEPTELTTEPAAHQPTPRRRFWRTPLAAPWLGRIVSALIGAFLVGAAWTATTLITATSEPDSFTMHGSMTLSGETDDSYYGCTGTGGYSDIGEGTTVTVYDAEEHVLGVGELGESTSDEFGCTFSFDVADVPKDEKFYRVEVAHRGKVTYSAEQATSGDIEMSLGD